MTLLTFVRRSARRKVSLAAGLILLCILSVFYASVVNRAADVFNTGTQSVQRWHGEYPRFDCRDSSTWAKEVSVVPSGLQDVFGVVEFGLRRGAIKMSPAIASSMNAFSSRNSLLRNNPSQAPDLDYSTFNHTSQRHTSLACSSCHERRDNSATPRFPGHKACTTCHLAQFVTPAVPMCVICHTEVNSSNPQMKSFPASFKESFNVKFDHSQHVTGAVRPQGSCSACHGRLGGRAAALSIPSGLAAHNQCYVCHTPNSRSPAGRDVASCGVCHDQRSYRRTPTNARAFRFAFSHAEHGPRQRLGCPDCHLMLAGAPQSRQVSSPSTAEHFPVARRISCFSCHNGKRSFGGDLAFKDCRRCHAGASFRMPM